MKKAKADAVPNRRTTIELPEDLWRAAKHRAVDDDTDLRGVIVAALALYLQEPRKGTKRA